MYIRIHLALEVENILEFDAWSQWVTKSDYASEKLNSQFLLGGRVKLSK